MGMMKSDGLREVYSCEGFQIQRLTETWFKRDFIKIFSKIVILERWSLISSSGKFDFVEMKKIAFIIFVESSGRDSVF